MFALPASLDAVFAPNWLDRTNSAHFWASDFSSIQRGPATEFLGKPESARWAVPLLIPISILISRHERPCERRLAILKTSTTFRGLPSRFSLGPGVLTDQP